MSTWCRTAWEWIKEHWKSLRWVLVILGAAVAYKVIRTRIAHLVDWVSRPASWQRIPGNQTHVIAKNPATGNPETIELPAGVKASEVDSIGISQPNGNWEVVVRHGKIDRHGDPDLDSGDSLDISG